MAREIPEAVEPVGVFQDTDDDTLHDLAGDPVGQLAAMVANHVLLRGGTEEDAAREALGWLRDPARRLHGYPWPLAWGAQIAPGGRHLVILFECTRDEYQAAAKPM